MSERLKVDLTGLRVLVTAGASGIGRVTVESFLANGAKVHLCDVDETALAAARAELPGAGVSRCDVSLSAEVDGLFEAAMATLGGLDVLVNNAGVAGPTLPVEEIGDEDWRRVQAVNVDGQFFCVRRAVPLLRAAGGGSIVNLSSAAGRFGFPLRTPYSASKWAVVGFTRTLAMELGPQNIRVNAICPGAVEGERIERVIAAKAAQRGITEEQMRAEVVADTSLRSFVSQQDIANQILYLCSPLGATISGQAIAVDAGLEVLR
ncbi:NAD(P)-dependent dehydrogenase, short-chain alcohol dehydrogenase family [Tistlia consotensis]|uniref:NAD(P)-dependent dehydrogenase, short-chain alcohol dehydrogenase family n=1 Tax=Tistlia consotensis USBA 355 TaxID=560819 RepID=A0A1Y6BXV3_9PROT|nr:SDR family oxidoreductase [Tistlia consotensis]SMF23557.1 NAD(P)-dependent dehydrogenase, short-chain alcohol dehydrogenase family [Tistlia consotensis USBA 355]SNR61493.1 NAD(P)-dependent dehydrogenase, short-chain alcohol dehydrogenase family [Tistlia consotensis]